MIEFLKSFFLFLRDEWLWSMTWGWYQISFGLLCTWFLFVYTNRLKSLPALLLTATSYWSAFVIYTLFILLISHVIIQIDYVPGQTVINSMHVSFFLGIIFTILQTFFFQITNQWYHLKMKQVIAITFLGNSIAAFFVTYCMRFAIMHTS